MGAEASRDGGQRRGDEDCWLEVGPSLRLVTLCGERLLVLHVRVEGERGAKSRSR